MSAPDTRKPRPADRPGREDPHRPQRLPGAGVDDGHLAHRAVLRDGDEVHRQGGQPADLDRCGARLGVLHLPAVHRANLAVKVRRPIAKHRRRAAGRHDPLLGIIVEQVQTRDLAAAWFNL